MPKIRPPRPWQAAPLPVARCTPWEEAFFNDEIGFEALLDKRKQLLKREQNSPS